MSIPNSEGIQPASVFNNDKWRQNSEAEVNQDQAVLHQQHVLPRHLPHSFLLKLLSNPFPNLPSQSSHRTPGSLETRQILPNQLISTSLRTLTPSLPRLCPRPLIKQPRSFLDHIILLNNLPPLGRRIGRKGERAYSTNLKLTSCGWWSCRHVVDLILLWCNGGKRVKHSSISELIFGVDFGFNVHVHVGFVDVGVGFFVDIVKVWARLARREEKAWLDGRASDALTCSCSSALNGIVFGERVGGCCIVAVLGLVELAVDLAAAAEIVLVWVDRKVQRQKSLQDIYHSLIVVDCFVDFSVHAILGLS